jgi:hypothetical protein
MVHWWVLVHYGRLTVYAIFLPLPHLRHVREIVIRWT